MANIKISELSALTPPDAADLVPVTDSSASQTKRTTVGEIVGIINGDVDVANDGTATISELPVSKLQDGAARQLLQTDAAGTGVEWTSNVDVPGTLDVTGATTLDSTLGVTGQSTLASAAVSDLTSGRVVLAGTSGELEDNAGLTFNGTQLDVDGDVVITGDLTVEGASTILETEIVKVADKNIELGVVASPTDVTADGGGITLKGSTDKTIAWVDSTDSWTSSENIDLANGKSYRINDTEVLSATTLGSGVTSSSLTSVGTISAGTWQGTAIDAVYLDSTVVTTGDTGSVTSTMIADGTIVNADVSASAAIAGTKIDPDFGSQMVETTGDLAINTDTLFVDASASAVGINNASPNFPLHILSTGTVAQIEGTNSASVELRLKNTIRDWTTYVDTTGDYVFRDRTGAAEAMRINNAQELLIGYTSDNGAYKLQVNSQIFATSATIATSDSRYKENVATLDSCVDLIKALRPVSFDWKAQQPITRVDEDGETVVVREAHNFPDGKQVGFIAQEVEEVLADKPWLGSVIKQNVRPAVTDADGNELAPEEEFLGIAEGNLVAVLTSALKDAIGRIESLEAEVAALKA